MKYIGNRKGRFLDKLSVPTIGIAAAIPLLMLFDFAAAFPSVSHTWMFAVIEIIKLWLSFIRAIKNMYKGNKAYGMFGGVTKFLFDILSGVLRGCPMSGTIFVFSIDPLLLLFKLKVNSALVRVCAGDVGAALRRLDMITMMQIQFENLGRHRILF